MFIEILSLARSAKKYRKILKSEGLNSGEDFLKELSNECPSIAHVVSARFNPEELFRGPEYQNIFTPELVELWVIFQILKLIC